MASPQRAGSDAKPLKAHLFKEYGGFADKRYKNLDKSDLFIVDDRRDSDRAADGSLFLWFCTIFVRVRSATEADVELGGDVPTSDGVVAWIKAKNGEWETHPPGLRVPITLGEEDRLDELATLMDQIVKSGKRYPVASYKYVCPRTAKSLRRLATALRSAPRP